MFQNQGVPAPDEKHHEIAEHPLPEGGVVHGKVGGHEGRGEVHLEAGRRGAPLSLYYILIF